MLGRVVLYIDVTYTRQRPDSSRPQAARSRAATRVSGVETGTARRCSAPIINIAANEGNRLAAPSVLYGKTRRTPIYGSAGRAV